MSTNSVAESQAKGKAGDSRLIVEALGLILEPGQVTELRALEAVLPGDRRQQTVSGYFDDPEKLAAAALSIRSAKGIYFVPNPVDPALLARAANRIRPAGREPLTSDGNILCRRWLPIDADAIRPAGISATDAEHVAAIERIRTIATALHAAGWPWPILADSGNGGHAMYRIDVPAEDCGLVQRCLAALALRFDDGAVTIDQTVHNPARIWKLYGTLACKGDDTPDRPHRLARIIEAPQTLEVVPVQSLEKLAALLPREEKPVRLVTGLGTNGSFDVQAWITRHSLDVRGPTPWQGGQKWIFGVCPWNVEHTNASAYILKLPNGAVAAGCHHNGCVGRDWHALRDVVEPGWRNRVSASTRPSSQPGRSGQPADEDADLPILTDSPPWPRALGDSAFHGLAGEIVRAIEPHTEADPTALLTDLLISLGSMIGRTAHFVADGAEHYANLFGVLVGVSAKGRKGTTRAQVQRVIAPIEPDWSENCIQTGLSSGEGLIWAVRDPSTRLEAVKEKGRRTGEVEEVEVDAGVSDKRLLVVEGEFSSVLRVAGRDGSTLSPLIRQAWDGGKLQSMTKNSPAVATGAHISIIGHITRDELRRYLDSTEAANGFGNRFLWVCVRRSKSLPEGGRIEEVDFSSMRDRLAAAVQFAREVEEIRRDDLARGIWREVYPDLSEGKPGLFGSVTSRAEAQVMRLAMIYAIMDRSPVIRAEHLLAGLAIWQYCELSAAHVFGSALGDPMADELLRALRFAGNAGMTRTGIRDLFRRHKGAEQINAVLGRLLEGGYVRCEREQTDGRPAERWFVTYASATEATKATEGGIG